MPRKKQNTGSLELSVKKKINIKQDIELNKVSIKKKSSKKVTIKEQVTPIEIEIEYDKEPLYKYSSHLSLHPKRNSVYKKFFVLLQKYNDKNFEIDKLQLMAINIEKSIFNFTLINSENKLQWTSLFQNLYISKSVTVFRNLNPIILQNINLIKRLFNNEFNETEIVDMTPCQIFPERYKELFDQITASLPKIADALPIEDGLFKCGKCKSYKTTYTEYQSRSADEPTTKRVHCTQCDNVWKFC